MIKLEWVKSTDEIYDEEETVYFTEYEGHTLEVYPVRNSKGKLLGFEYSIRFPEEKPNKTYLNEYDSLYESSNGNDHARTVKIAKGWAENTLKDFLEEN